MIVDAAHGTGRSYLVAPLARAGVAVGADGLMVEVHARPDEALSDGPNMLPLDEFPALAKTLLAIRAAASP